MKQLIIILLAAFLTFSCNISDNIYNVDHIQASAESDFTYTLSSMGKNRLVLYAVNGPVVVTGINETDSVRISGTKRVESESKADALHYLDDMYIDISEEDQSLYVQTRQPDDSQGRSYFSSYQIQIPENWSTALVLVNGSIHANTLHAHTQARIVNGDIYLDEIYGGLNATVTNGSINANVNVPEYCEQNFKTENGSISLTIPQSTSAWLYASVNNGMIQASGLTIDPNKLPTRALQEQLGDGKSTITLSSTNGNINLVGR